MFQKKIVLLAVAMLSTVSAFDFYNFEIDPLIVQGENATRGQFPYYAFLQIRMPQGEGACGGSLISNQWVISAAHCLKGAKSVRVHLGSLRAKDEKEEGRIMVEVPTNDIHVHPKYFQLLALNDIGLIKLPEPVKFTDFIKPLVSATSQALIGLSDFVNIQGCNLGFPQGFTRVASYLDWIKTVAGVSDCQQEI